jgi:hypothetical protein
MRNHTVVLTSVILIGSISIVGLGINTWRLQSLVWDYESKMLLIDPMGIPVGSQKSSWPACLIRPKPPLYPAWRVCFPPELLKNNPDFPEQVKMTLERMRDSGNSLSDASVTGNLDPDKASGPLFPH